MTEAFEPIYRNTLLVVLLGFFVLERLHPVLHRVLRRPVASASRWFPNLSLFVLGGLTSRLVFPASVVALAAGLDASGLLGRFDWPLLVDVVLGFLALDLLNYGLHRLSHAHPLLWRAHLVHHTDVQVDVTTSVRHHPIEALVNAGLTAVVVIVLGLPWQAIAAYLLVAVTVAAWSHANLRWPAWLERVLGTVFVTPGLHVQHHSAQREQTDSNYGQVFSFWDRLFGTYTPPHASGPQALGLEYFRSPRDNTLTAVLLRQPFVRHLPAPDAPDDLRNAPRTSRTRPLSSAWREALGQLAIGLGLLAPVMAPTVLTMAHQWSVIEAYRYAWLVLPMLAYAFGWHWRDELLAMRPQPTAAGVLFAAVAGFGWVAADVLNIELGRQLALVAMVFALVLAAFGPVMLRRWFPVLALLFYMVPSSDALQPLLRWITNEGLAHTLALLGLPVRSEGFLLLVDGKRYFVADACSGLAYVTLLAFLGHALGMLVYRSLWRVLAMALLGALLGVLTNLVRVNAIVLIDRWQGTQMDLAAHGHVQWVSLVVALALMLWVVARSRPEPALPRPPVHTKARVPAGNPVAGAGTLSGLLGLAIVGTGTLVLGLATPALAPLSGAMLPASLGDWARNDTAAVLPLRIDGSAVISGEYARQSQRLRLDVLQARDRRTKLGPQALAPASDDRWRVIRQRSITVCAMQPCLSMVHTTQRLNAATPLRHAYIVQGVGDTVGTSPLQLRAAAAWHALTGHPVGPYLIALTVDGETLAPDDAQGLLRAAIDALRAHSGAGDH